MKIFFSGTGGGRVNLVKQIRSTAGFLIQGSKWIYVDPGPGVIFQAKKFKIPLHKIDILYISHIHTDHANDAGLLVEAMTSSTFKKRGTIVADEVVLNGNDGLDRAISRYHQSLVEKVFSIKKGKIVEFENIKFTGTETKHGDPGTGFVLEMDGKRIGYTSDTEYFDGLNVFKDCDMIIINMLKITKKEEMREKIKQMDFEEVVKFLKISKPKKAIITRFGMEFIRTNPRAVAKELTKKTNVETFASYDGFSFEL